MSADVKRQMFESIKNRTADYGKLKRSIFPEKVYKYYRPDEYALCSLEENYLYLSSPLGFNDPYDSQVGFINNPNADPVFYRLFNQQVNQTVRVGSLSEVKDSILMWGHYAKSHTGFCIEYDFSDPVLEPDLVQFYAVHYTDQVYDIETSRKNGDDFIQTCILTTMCKHIDWQYEKEWRIFDQFFYGDRFPMPTPSAIYFGAKSDSTEKYTSKVFDIAKARGIPTYLMIPKTDKFELTFEVVDKP